MAWTGQFARNVSDMFTGVEGYFARDGISLGGPLTPVGVDDQSTTTRVTFQAANFLGEISFIGAGLQVANTPTPGGAGSIPTFTAGTVTRIEVRFNAEMNDLITALALANTVQEQQRIEGLILQMSNEQTLRSLPLNAAIDTDPFAAAALSNAVLASYQARDIAPIRAFLSQFNHNYTSLGPGDVIGFDNDDILIGGPGLSNVYGGAGNDTLSGGSGGPNGLYGQAGSDFYLMSAGADLVSDDGTDGGFDVISYQLATGPVVVEMDVTGTVRMQGYAQGDNFVGVEGVIGSSFSDVLIGRSTVWGELSSDLLDGGAGDDTLVGGEGSDTLRGGAGFDLIDGGPSQTVTGNPGPGDMVLYAAGPNQVHFFNSSNGLLIATPREGIDLVVNVELFNFGGQVFTRNQLTISNATPRIGDDNANALTGGNGDDLIFGRGGNDRLEGNGGNDIIDGGMGNDTLVGGTGSDTLSGGDGSDVLNGGDSDDFIFGGETDRDLRDVVYAGAGNDSVDGGAGNDEIRGDAGNDTLEGGVGADTVIGGDGNDVVSGGAWGDALFGGTGSDFLNGGFGFDQLNGGAGGDRFFHAGAAGHGSDWIQDYRAGEGDLLVYGGGAAARADFLVQRAATPGAGAGGVAEVFITHRPSGQILWALVDGDAQDTLNVSAGGTTFDLLG